MAKSTEMVPIKFMLIAALVYTMECSQIEPANTKFTYDEQLLEKMVRMEFKVETLVNDIKTTQTEMGKELTTSEETILSEMESIQKEKEKMKTEFENLKEELTAKIKSQSDEMTTVFKRQEDQIIRMSEDLRNMENVTVQKLTDLATIPSVAFKARQLADRNPDTNQIFVFKTNMLNKGQGYDNVTGIFKVPVGGVYLFTVQLCTSSQTICFAIVADDEFLTNVRSSDSASTTCYSSEAIAILEPGARVWVKSTVGSSAAIISESHSTTGYGYWNTFSGVLVHK